MKWLAPLLLAFTSLAWPSLGSAQSIYDGIDVVVDGETLLDGEKVFIGSSQCEKDDVFRFEINMYPVMAQVLELWVSNSASVDCSTAANRTAAAPEKPLCWLVGSVTNVQANSNRVIEADAVDIFSQQQTGTCDVVANITYTAHVVPLTAPTPVGSAGGSDPISGATIWKVAFTLYTETPPAPTGVTGSSGETSLGIDWNGPESADKFTSYRVYYDLAQGGAGDLECGSGKLITGMKAPVEGGTIIAEDEDNEGGSLSDLDGRVEIGESVAAAVVTIDPGGNESLLSEVICIERVETDGFYDRYKDMNGKGLETCSMGAPGQAAWGGLGSLTILALALVARRRRTT